MFRQFSWLSFFSFGGNVDSQLRSHFQRTKLCSTESISILGHLVSSLLAPSKGCPAETLPKGGKGSTSGVNRHCAPEADQAPEMRLHGAEAGEEEKGVGKRRRGGGGGGGGERDHQPTPRRDARPSRSPNTRKRRAVAADLFDDGDNDDDDDDDDDDDEGNDRQRRHNSTPRSRSPPPGPDHKRRRHRDRDHHEKRRRHRHHAKRADPAVELPFDARQLSYKHDFDAFTALFAYYLDIQKNLDFYSLDSHEARGRWKSFVHKWNRGELAEGWYEPEMYERVTREDPARMAAAREYSTGGDDDEDEGPQGEDISSSQERPEGTTVSLLGERGDAKADEDDVDDYGPPPPPGQLLSSDTATGDGPRHGPGIPTHADLALQREAAAEASETSRTALRLARKADRAQQKERLDDILPRAEPGTRERKLEKKALVNDKMRSFRDKGDAMEEVGDRDLMGGGGEDDLAEYKRMLASQQRKKTERELRREAEARAKAAEREERLREWKEREEEKLKGLKELARARFG